MGKKIVIKLIRFYQLVLSPYKGRSYCNYVPSCSQYAVEAIDMYGVILGGWLAFKRILRCNPFHKGGFDPVPILTLLYSIPVILVLNSSISTGFTYCPSCV